MKAELLLLLLSRWMHVGTAIVLVGGTCCLKFVVLPSLVGQSPEIAAAIRNRWKKFVHAGIALFLLSGFYNYFQAMPLQKGNGLYHGLIGTKILVAMVIFFLASVLVGRSPGTQKFRDNSGKWMTVIIVLAAVVVGISGFLKVGGAQKPQLLTPPSTASGSPATE
jgi:uncharacterized membrane protein